MLSVCQQAHSTKGRCDCPYSHEQFENWGIYATVECYCQTYVMQNKLLTIIKWLDIPIRSPHAHIAGFLKCWWNWIVSSYLEKSLLPFMCWLLGEKSVSFVWEWNTVCWNCFSKFRHCHKFSHCALLIGLSTVITPHIKIYSLLVGLINSAVSISQL